MPRNRVPFMLALTLFAGVVAGLGFTASAAASLLVSESFAHYTGAGLAPGGGEGRLDSEHWAVLGFSDGDSAFGGQHLSGDLARGEAAEAVRSGGLYAFSLPAGAVGLGVQATSSDFSPGAVLWRVSNSADGNWVSLSLSFDLWLRNDGDRTTGLAVDLALSDALDTWIALPEASLLSPGTADDL